MPAAWAEALAVGRIGFWTYTFAERTYHLTDEFYRAFRTTAEAEGGYLMTAKQYAERFVPLEHRSLVEREVAAAELGSDANSRKVLDHPVLFADGQSGHIQVTLHRLSSDEIPSPRLLGVVQDMTELRRAVRESVETERKLQAAHRLEGIGKLTGGIAHDLNNLLTVISGNVEMLSLDHEGSEDDDIRASLSALTEAVARGRTLTTRLLAFAQRDKLSPSKLDLSTVLRRVASMLEPTIGDGIELACEEVGEGLSVFVDLHQLENAIVNLAMNARDAMPGGGHITLRASRHVQPNEQGGASVVGGELPEGQFVAISITDEGEGIPEEHLDRVFEPFFTTKPKGMGTGLGLSSVLGFAEQSGGYAQMKSRVGEGTTLTLYFPDAGEVSTPELGSDGPSEGRDQGRMPSCVLLVEDQPEVRRVVDLMLGRLCIETLRASDAKEAYEVFENNKDRIDLLMTDIGLPGIETGLTLAHNLRRKQPDLPVMFISGYATEFPDESGLLESEHNLLRKPFGKEELLVALQRVFGRLSEP